MKRSIHIEAPVEKVFDCVKDPTYMPEGFAMPFEVTDVKLADGGVGTYYSWVYRVAGLTIEGFDVYTEFIPNQRITDRSSSGFPGDFTFSFEPEGSGMKLTVEVRHRSFWRIPPLMQLVEMVQGLMIDRLLSAMKAEMEA